MIIVMSLKSIIGLITIVRFFTMFQINAYTKEFLIDSNKNFLKHLCKNIINYNVSLDKSIF